MVIDLVNESLVGCREASRDGSEAPLFTCIADRDTPKETCGLLREAALARGLSIQMMVGEDVPPWMPPLPPGSLLMRSGTSWAAAHAEAQLFQAGVVTLYRSEEGPYAAVMHSELRFGRYGLPMPRWTWLRSTEPTYLERIAEWLGGFPLVLRVPGGERGVGTLRVDSLPALISTADLLLHHGPELRISAYIAEAMHWRVVVVGDSVASAYRNPVRPGDFRSSPSESPEDYGLEPSPEVAALAIQATRVLGLEHAGVDVLVDAEGRTFLLEANFPCYFAQAHAFGRGDVAGALLDHLLAKRARQRAAAAQESIRK